LSQHLVSFKIYYMSYLNNPRLIFSGDFQADVNTVNNDVTHYYNPAFTEDNWVQAKSGEGGWWNPDGGSTFRFVNCAVKQVCYPDGSKTNDASQDAVIGKSVTGPLNESSAKLVDLDPQFQFTSQIWGLKLCIYGSEDEVLLSGSVEPSGFKDLQFRNFPPIQNGQPLGASWTSVIYDLKWGKKARDSKILSALMDRSAETGLLSCNLTSFGYYKIIGGERFTLGRLLGAVAPYIEGDPHQFAPARRLIGLDLDYAAANNLIAPDDIVPEFAFSNCHYDERQARLAVDLGGSFPLSHPLGVPKDVGNLYIGVAKSTNLRELLPDVTTPSYYFIKDDSIVTIGQIDYSEEWLLNTAGISDFNVTGEAQKLIGNRQIVLFTDAVPDYYKVLACETKNGLSVRADNNVRRIDSKPKGPVDFDFNIRTYQWGKKIAGKKITFMRNTPKNPTVPQGIDPDTGEVIPPYTNWPAETVLINGKQNVEVISDEHGVATVTVSVYNPENKRAYIDGQIFLIGYMLEGLPTEQQYNLTFMELYLMDGLIMHVRNAFEEIKEPHWSDLAEIMTQYSNLYPLMSKNILDLSDPKEIAARKKIMLYAFTRDMHDPTYMPVSRDLSEGKRKTIVNWLNTGMKGADEDITMPRAMLRASTPHLPKGGNKTSQELNVKTKDDFYNE
jgi:hypothetical protein